MHCVNSGLCLYSQPMEAKAKPYPFSILWSRMSSSQIRNPYQGYRGIICMFMYVYSKKKISRCNDSRERGARVAVMRERKQHTPLFKHKTRVSLMWCSYWAIAAVRKFKLMNRHVEKKKKYFVFCYSFIIVEYPLKYSNQRAIKKNERCSLIML